MIGDTARLRWSLGGLSEEAGGAITAAVWSVAGHYMPEYASPLTLQAAAPGHRAFGSNAAAFHPGEATLYFNTGFRDRRQLHEHYSWKIPTGVDPFAFITLHEWGHAVRDSAPWFPQLTAEFLVPFWPHARPGEASCEGDGPAYITSDNLVPSPAILLDTYGRLNAPARSKLKLHPLIPPAMRVDVNDRSSVAKIYSCTDCRPTKDFADSFAWHWTSVCGSARSERRGSGAACPGRAATEIAMPA